MRLCLILYIFSSMLYGCGLNPCTNHPYTSVANILSAAIGCSSQPKITPVSAATGKVINPDRNLLTSNTLSIKATSNSSNELLLSSHTIKKFPPLLPGEISFYVNTGNADAVTGYPVSFALPFPVGSVQDSDGLRLSSDDGSLLSAQFTRLSTWFDGSTKTSLLTFYPEREGINYKSYKVLYGKKMMPVAAAPPNNITISEDPTGLLIDTGAALFRMDKNRFTFFDQVYIGSDERKIVKIPGDLTAKDGKTGKVFRSSRFFKKDGYSLTVLEKGPLRAVVKAEGKLRSEDSSATSENGTDFITFKVWLTFYASTGIVHVKYTFIDAKNRPGDLQKLSKPVLALKDTHFELPLDFGDMSYVAGGESDSLYKGKVIGEKYLLQDAVRVKYDPWKGYKYFFSYTGIGAGEKAPGWFDIEGTNYGVTAAIRNFWENYPNKISINDKGILLISLQPEESENIFTSTSPGVAKTHDILLNFHINGYSDEVRKTAEIYLANPVILASPEWYAITSVFGQIAPPSRETAAWDFKVNRQFDCSALAKGCSRYPLLYGKNDFGDYQLGYDTNNNGEWSVNKGVGHYEDAHGWILEFLRQGEKKFFDFAAQTASHHYDIDVMHVENSFNYPSYPSGMIRWHGGEDTIEAGHIVPGGIDEYYLLTGDLRALDVSREQGDWIAHKAATGGLRIIPEKPDDEVGLDEYERPHAWPLYTVLKTYETTGDKKYWDAATIIVKNTIDWWKMPQAIEVFTPGKKLNPKIPAMDQTLYYEKTDWTKGNGYWVSTLRTDNCSQTSEPLHNYDYQNHVPVAWMAAFLETALIRYYEHLKSIGGRYTTTVKYRGDPVSMAVDSDTMREMIIQTVDVLVNHNYISTKYPSRFPWLATLNFDHFVYSACPERDPRSSDGAIQLPFVLLYASNFKKEEVSERWKTNWESLQAKWRDIARTQYMQSVEKNSEPMPGYNGAQLLWNMPYAVNLLFK